MPKHRHRETSVSFYLAKLFDSVQSASEWRREQGEVGAMEMRAKIRQRGGEQSERNASGSSKIAK